jgi:hypothetical protein
MQARHALRQPIKLLLLFITQCTTQNRQIIQVADIRGAELLRDGTFSMEF